MGIIRVVKRRGFPVEANQGNSYTRVATRTPNTTQYSSTHYSLLTTYVIVPMFKPADSTHLFV